MNPTTSTATPAKLQDGTWGARVPGAPKIGDIIAIRTAAGKTWNARVVAIIRAAARPGDSSLVATESIDRPSGSLADRGLIRVGGSRGSYVRRMDRQDRFDEYDM